MLNTNVNSDTRAQPSPNLHLRLLRLRGMRRRLLSVLLGVSARLCVLLGNGRTLNVWGARGRGYRVLFMVSVGFQTHGR